MPARKKPVSKSSAVIFYEETHAGLDLCLVYENARQKSFENSNGMWIFTEENTQCTPQKVILLLLLGGGEIQRYWSD